MSLEQSDIEQSSRPTRDLVSEMQAREVLDTENFQGESVDFLGPLLRRKSIIILFCIVASGIGYLIYRKELPTYQSGLRIMIFVQTPPTIINGEPMALGVSIPKQQALIVSQVVIEDAIVQGKLGDLETFRGIPAPFFLLNGLLKVTPAPASTDALDIKCSGPVAEDLPLILRAIVEAYDRSLNDDSASSAQRSIDLIEKVQLQVAQEAESRKRRMHELLSKLDVSSDSEASEYRNDTLELMKQLDLEKRERNTLLVRVNEKLSSIYTAAAFEGEQKQEYWRSIAIEAEKYLSIGGYQNNTATLFSDSADRMEQSKRLQAAIERNNENLTQLELQSKIFNRTNGENHPSSIGLQIKMESLKSQNEGLAAEKVKLQNMIESDKGKEAESAKDTKSGKERINDSSIRIYEITLRREQQQHQEAINRLDQQIKAIEELVPVIRAEMAELNMLRNELKVKDDSNRGMMEKLGHITVMANNFTATRVKVINSPQVGGVIAPILKNYLLFSILIGGLIGSGLAILIDRADLTFRNPYEIFQKMKVPVICKIPTITKMKGKNEFGCVPTLVTALDPRSSGAEAFRACRTALLFFSNHSGAKVFLLSSPTAGDGKSTTVSNLAVSIAQGGKRVVILDADMRRPRQHKYFGMSMKPGLMGLDAKTSTLDEIIRPTFQENLSLVTCGGHPSNPGEFVVSATFSQLLTSLRERFDFILVDSPPILPVADATSLSTQVDGVILVFRIRKGIVIASQRARELLDLVHARMLGIVVNGVDQNPYYNEYGGYGYPSNSGYAASRYYEKQAKEYSETVDS